MRKFIVLVVALAALLVSTVAPASAITYGEPDNGRHPNVGELVIAFNGGLFGICSGTLISPTVFLTASHCTAFAESLGLTGAFVTFDEAFDPATSTLLPGTMVTNPDFSQRQSDTGDIAVIVLDAPVNGLTPAALPTLGLFDQLKQQNALKGQTFTAVGYGVHEVQVGGGPPVFPGGDTRRVATSSFSALNKTWLRLSQNPSTGDSGTCFGDSGGPNFLGDSDMIASITITGDSMCRSTNVTYRLDTPSARNFLDDFVAVP